jgi:hypothetical protein
MKALPDFTKSRRTKHGWIRAFLDCLKNNGNITQSARCAGVTKANVYFAMRRHPQFRKAVDAALEESHDLIRAEAQRRAIQGVNEPVIWQGQMQGHWVDVNGKECLPGTEGGLFIPLTVKRYSDMILKVLLQSFVKGCKQEPVTVINNTTNNTTQTNVLHAKFLDRVIAARHALEGHGSGDVGGNGKQVDTPRTNGKADSISPKQ